MSQYPCYLFLAEMELHGILTFSSEIRPAVAGIGAVHITSHFIHNYPLIYAFNRRIAEAYIVIPSLHQPFKSSKREKRKRVKKPLQYTFVDQVLKEIQLSNLRHIYSYPAYPAEVTIKKFFLSAKGYGYVERVKRQIKSFYPTETNWISLVPPTRHYTLLISPHNLPRRLYIRIGMKRTGLYKVSLYEIRPINIRAINSLEWSSIPVNLYDVRLFNYIVEDYIKVLETRSEPESKRGANSVGYVRARGLYEITTPIPNLGRIIVPLPESLFKMGA